jgi:hypothetical protein
MRRHRSAPAHRGSFGETGWIWQRSDGSVRDVVRGGRAEDHRDHWPAGRRRLDRGRDEAPVPERPLTPHAKLVGRGPRASSHPKGHRARYVGGRKNLCDLRRAAAILEFRERPQATATGCANPERRHIPVRRPQVYPNDGGRAIRQRASRAPARERSPPPWNPGQGRRKNLAFHGQRSMAPAG